MRIDVDKTWRGVPLPRDQAATVRLSDEGSGLRVRVDAPWYRDPAPATPPGALDGLWNHEVVEVFVAGPGAPVPYTELELGPHGHHLLITLRGVRQDTARALPTEVTASTDRRGGRLMWRAQARIDAAHLPPRPWTVNVCAIHGVGDERVYESHVALPGEAPDFHQPARFVPWRDEAFPGDR